MSTVLINCGPIVHVDSNVPITGQDMLDDKWIIAKGEAIVIEDSLIKDIGNSMEILDDYQSHDSNEVNIIDVYGKAIIPGIIDSHTHMVWGGDRSREVRWKQQGNTYSDIANMGGGIVSTVNSTRSLSEADLYAIAKQRMMHALKNGTTHIETKSGYGLDTKTEMKLLRVAKQLRDDNATPSVDSTWLGAHAIPDNHTLDSYTEEIITQQLPLVAEAKLARSADVFCEPGWFGIDESEQILKAAKSHGMNLRMHIDEFSDGGGGELAAKLRVDTADHAHYTSEENRDKMSKADVSTGFLPGTPYSMGSDWPDFNSMIENNHLWTIATDFNPNNQILSMPFVASCIVQRCGVDPLAALVASTINPSFTTPHPTGMRHGVIAKGAVANLNILNSKHWESWCLTPGHSPISANILNGQYNNYEY
ncbi:MAG: imidazolonepropionase [Candidatus Poseidoniaceae archaeon]|nr:imidazolonepropionase [Candidatus Poseidoniaceae archaeon]MBL6895786.1 imidazolonepropionase [Candidatus Poseidoniaceae archaeon]